MTDIELVIKIPEEKYKEILNSDPSHVDDFSIYHAIKNGTPLPKGHGRLIDADEAAETVGWEMSGTGYQTVAVWPLKSDSYTPTIIEADQGNAHGHAFLDEINP